MNENWEERKTEQRDWTKSPISQFGRSKKSSQNCNAVVSWAPHFSRSVGKGSKLTKLTPDSRKNTPQPFSQFLYETFSPLISAAKVDNSILAETVFVSLHLHPDLAGRTKTILSFPVFLTDRARVASWLWVAVLKATLGEKFYNLIQIIKRVLNSLYWLRLYYDSKSSIINAMFDILTVLTVRVCVFALSNYSRGSDRLTFSSAATFFFQANFVDNVELSMQGVTACFRSFFAISRTYFRFQLDAIY